MKIGFIIILEWVNQFGKIKIDIDISKYKDALQEFEILMREWIGKEWIETEQIKELFTMSFKDLNIDNKLKYLKLDPENNINEFVDKKKNKECLPKVSQMFDIGENFPKSLLSDEILKEREEAKKVEEQRDKFVSSLNMAKKTQNIQILENLLKNDLSPEEEIEVKETIELIKENIQKIQEKEVQKEAIEKWDAILRLDKKYKEKAIKEYIKNYPNSPKLLEAKEELEKYKSSDSNNKILDFSNTDDIKSIERVMKSIPNPTDEDKIALVKTIERVYPNLNAKKKKQFERSKLIPKWIGKSEF